MTQAKLSGFWKVDLEKFRKRNGSPELLTITIKVVLEVISTVYMFRPVSLQVAVSHHISASRKRNHFRKNVGEERGFPKPLVNAEMHSRRITVSKILEFKIWTALVILLPFC